MTDQTSVHPFFSCLKHKNSIILILLLLISIGIALNAYQNYGISWDEPAQRTTGFLNLAYILDGDERLLSYKDRDYGPAFELMLAAMESYLKPETSKDMMMMRHLVTHLFFIVGAVFCFLLIDFLYQNKLLATAGFLLVMLHPRLYAHSYFNTKDIPFLSMFFICFYLSAKAFNSYTKFSFIFLGFFTGLLINLRIMGILFAGCVLLFLLSDVLSGIFQKRACSLPLTRAFLFVGSATITLYLTWPFLWTGPVENFIVALENMSKFRWEGAVLFKGLVIKASELPWSYIPTWFAITTPVLYIIAGFFGAGLLLFNAAKAPGHIFNNSLFRNQLTYFICFFAPVTAVIYLQSVLYDGWRHMYFIYSAFVMLAIYGLDFLFKTRFKKAVIGGFVVVFCATAWFMVLNAPYQHVYFNALVDQKTPEHLRKTYELDYWGTSYRQALEYVLSTDSNAEIQIAVQNKPGEYNIFILPADQASRITLTKDISKTNYFLTNYRGVPHDYFADLGLKEVHSIKVGNNTINSVFKLR